MRPSAIVMSLALLSPLGLPGAASAQSTPSDVRDLVGARGSSGETALTNRGYVNVGGETGDDRSWTYWWNERRGVCLSVATMNGRYDSIVSTPSPDCRRSRPTTLPGPVGGPVHDGRPTTLRATVQNLFDRSYWAGVASYGAFSQASPRTLQLSATVDF